MTSPFLILSDILLGFFGFLTIFAIRQFFKRRGLRQLRGPPSPSFWTGNELELRLQENVGDLEYKWFEEYGTAHRIAGCLGEDVLMLADPKGLQYVLQTSGYRYPKTRVVDTTNWLLMGTGIIWASGEDHVRHRRVMNPAFSAAQMRNYLTGFQSTASKLSHVWAEKLGSGTEVMKVNEWLGKLTLDALGEVAFDYHFGALDGEGSDLTQVYHNLFIDTAMSPPAWDFVFRSFWRYISPKALYRVISIPTQQYKRLKAFTSETMNTAKNLVDRKVEEVRLEKRQKDMMGILVQSNLSSDPKRGMSTTEIHAQMATLLLTGHETTSSTMAWLLYELAKNTKDQQALREEIAHSRRSLSEKGRSEFTVEDLDELPLLNAYIKETLRLYPIAFVLAREAAQDDVIPLSSPITSKDGETLYSIPIRKGQVIQTHLAGYNRLKQVWGTDADTWNPRRFMQENEDPDKFNYIGIYANLMSFSAGVRACIGWRFAIVQMQAVISELIERFEFSLAYPAGDILRVPAVITNPMVRNKLEEGVQLPLKVTALY